MKKGYKKFIITIDKRYFINPNSNRLSMCQFNPMICFAFNRKDAAQKIWEQNKSNWLKEIKSTAKIIRLYVSSGKTVWWIMNPVKVYERK